MVIFYNLETKEIDRTEENTATPTLPLNKTFDEKVASYREQGLGFVSIPQELGSYVWNYDLKFDSEGSLIGLQPKSATAYTSPTKIEVGDVMTECEPEDGIETLEEVPEEAAEEEEVMLEEEVGTDEPETIDKEVGVLEEEGEVEQRESNK